MPYTSLTSAQVTAGEPGTTTLFDLIRTNLDDLDSRLATVEAATGSTLDLALTADGRVRVVTQVAYQRFNFEIDINSGQVAIYDSDSVGTAGTLEIDIQHSPAPGSSYTTIFSTRPSLAFGVGQAISSNGVLTSTPFNIPAASILRLDIIAIQTNMRGFHGVVNYSAA